MLLCQVDDGWTCGRVGYVKRTLAWQAAALLFCPIRCCKSRTNYSDHHSDDDDDDVGADVVVVVAIRRTNLSSISDTFAPF